MQFSLETQIAEVNEEIRKRREIYGRLVNSGRMKQAAADYKIGCMQAARDSLAGLLAERAAARVA